VLEVHASGFRKRRVSVARGTSRVDVVLERGLRISGRLVDQDGKAISNVTIWCRGSATDEAGSSHPRSDAEGRFSLGGLHPGELELRPQDPFAKAPRYFPVRKLELSRDTDLGDLRAYTRGARLTVKFPKGTWPNGLVLQVSGETEPRAATPEGSGHRFDAVPPGRHAIEYRLGGVPRRQSVEVGSADQVIAITPP
jgi:hypothetical protein